MPAQALVAQCGAPTAVVNASLAAVLRACRADRRIGTLFGARHGLRGLAAGDLVDLSVVDVRRLELQPGALLGGGRDLLADVAFDRTAAELERRRIGFAFLIGGNGTMRAASALAARAGETRVVAIPKTIDNDIAETDVAPGYGIAARFVTQSVRDAGLDLYAMRGFDDVAVVEVMGRYAGRLAAGSALARHRSGSAPHVLLRTVDRALARQVGDAAVRAALDGRSAVMVALERLCDGWETRLVPLDRVVGRENALPGRFVAPCGLDVTEEFVAWAAPLAGEPFASVQTIG